jgi:hypothetical protein
LKSSDKRLEDQAPAGDCIPSKVAKVRCAEVRNILTSKSSYEQRLEEHALAGEGNKPSRETQAHHGAEETTILAFKSSDKRREDQAPAEERIPNKDAEKSTLLALKFDKGRDKRRLEECLTSNDAEELTLIAPTSSDKRGLADMPVSVDQHRQEKNLPHSSIRPWKASLSKA